MIWEYLGRFHPVLVHLPIGFYFLGLVLKLVASRMSLVENSRQSLVDSRQSMVENSRQSLVDSRQSIVDRSLGESRELSADSLKPIAYCLKPIAESLVLKITFIASIFTCVTGYLLSQSGEYEGKVLNLHQYLAFAFTALLGVFAFVKIKNNKIELGVWLGLGVILTIVGHYGGSLTHGEDFLSFSPETKSEKVAIADIQKAKVYNDLVRPIFEAKCVECHSSSKQKGGLRMDQAELLLKGGKHGTCLDPKKSILVSRMLMPLGEEEHMPPKGKTQLTENEIAVIKWWIENKADLTKTVSQLPQTTLVLPALLSFQDKKTSNINFIPETEVKEADASILLKLNQSGIVSMPVSKESNYLSINILNNTLNDAQWKLLEELKDQIILFKSNKANFSAEGVKTLAKLTNMRSLHLSNSNVEDKDLLALKTLNNLVNLNIIGTKITSDGLMVLNTLPKLQKLFIFNSFQMSAPIFGKLKLAFPKTQIDTGGYQVPTFKSDTTFIPYM